MNITAKWISSLVHILEVLFSYFWLEDIILIQHIRGLPLNRPRPLTSTFFPIHYSLIFLPFHVIIRASGSVVKGLTIVSKSSQVQRRNIAPSGQRRCVAGKWRHWSSTVEVTTSAVLERTAEVSDILPQLRHTTS
jgi:hypothetical protein